MPRVCKICTHEQSADIDRAIAGAKGSFRRIAAQFGVTEQGIRRHISACIPAALATLRDQQQQKRAMVVEDEVDRVFRRLNKLLEACDEWLQDPADPEKYTLDGRDYEFNVIYLDHVDVTEKGKPKRKKDSLANILARLDDAKLEYQRVFFKRADPRDLIVKTAAEIKGHLELIGRLRGLFQRDRENDSDVARAEARRKWAGEKLREVMSDLNLSEPKARAWMAENTPEAAKYLVM